MCRFPNPKIGEHPFSRSYGVILPSSFNMVLSSALVCSTCSPVSVWGTVIFHEVFSWKSSGLPNHPIHEFNKHAKKKNFCSIVKATSSLSSTHRTKPFREFLRDRFTLRRLTERRNPWTFGDHVFHMIYRYSCQHNHFGYLQLLSSATFDDLQNAPLPTLEKGSRGCFQGLVASVNHLSPDTFSVQLS
jgi:hypothetical protein